MDKFCGKCGAKLDEITGQCPACYRSIHTDKRTKNLLHKRTKRAVILVVLFIICICTVFILLGRRTLLESRLAPVNESFTATAPPETSLYVAVAEETVITESATETSKVPETAEETAQVTDAIAVTETGPTVTLEVVNMQPYGDPVSSVSASSTYSGDRANHDAENLRDEDPKTNWTEGVDGYGVGESIRFDFCEVVQLNSIQISGGNQYDYDRFKDNGRPEWIKLTFADGSSESFRLKDSLKSQTFELYAPVETDSVVLTINTVYEGRRYEDTVISDVSFGAYKMVSILKQVPCETTECTYVKFSNIQDRDLSGNIVEYGIFTGYGDSENELWKYESRIYDGGGQCNAIGFVGLNDNTLYFSENGALLALNLSSGAIRWKNKDFGGTPTACAFDENGTLYITGYLTPDLFAVEKYGSVIHKADTFDDRFYWPSAITLEGGFARITMDGHPIEVENSDSIIVVDLSDYTYELPADTPPMTDDLICSKDAHEESAEIDASYNAGKDALFKIFGLK